MAKVNLYVYPPLSYQMSSKRAGVLILDQEIGEGETSGDLVARLQKVDHRAWNDIFDVHTNQMRPAIMTTVNNTILSPTIVSQTPLSDGDQVAIRIIYTGG